MSRRLLRSPLLWLAGGAAVLVSLACTFAYLGAFLDPQGNAHGVPVAIASEDAGAVIAGNQVDLGKQLTAAVTASTDEAVAWTVLPTREAVLDRMRDDKAFAAIVVPRDASARVVGLLAPEPGAKPRIEILTNPAAGTIARSSGEQIATEAVTQFSRAAAAQLEQAVAAAGVQLSPASKVALASPLATTVAVGVPISAKSAEGVAPFFFALTVALGGFFLAAIVSFGVDLSAGKHRLELLGRTLMHEPAHATQTRLIAMKLALTVVLATATALLQALLAVKGLGMEATNPVGLAFFAALGSAAIGAITLFCLVAFDIVGRIIAVLFTLIFGVPSAGGVYPTQLVPGFFRWLGGFLPLEQMTAGARSLVFFDGRAAAGLGTAIWVLGGYLLASSALTIAIAALHSRKARAA